MKRLTEGPPLKLLLGFMLPLLLGVLFQQFYYMVDTIVVGKLLGADALAGVGSTGAINFLILGFCMGICFGFSIPIAQKFGRQDMDALRRSLGNIIWMGLLFGVLVTVTVTVLCRQILLWLHTPEATFAYAYTYIVIIFLGIPASMLYNILSGVIRSLGDSKTPLYFLIFSSLLNVALDLVLILWAKMGVAGAALATVIAQLVSGLLCIVFMVRHFPALHLSREDMKLRKKESRELLGMGVPMGLQYSITALGCTILQYSINGLGASAMAAVTAGGRINSLLACPMDAMGSAAATFAGQNVGAGKLHRVREGTRASFTIGFLYCCAALLLAVVFGDQLVMLFLKPGEANTGEILAMGKQYLLVCVTFFVPLLCVNLFRFTIQGMGFSHLAVAAGVMELLGRGGMAVLLVDSFGFSAVCFAEPAAWVLADLFLIPMYFIGLRILQKRLDGHKE